VPIRNPEQSHRVTGTSEPITDRHLVNRYYLPFSRRFGCTYPASGRAHIIYNCATPIDDDRMMLVQWLYRNDTEAECSTQELIDWDAADHRRGQGHPGGHRLRRLRRHQPPGRVPHGVRQARPGHPQAAAHLLRAHGEEEIYRGSPQAQRTIS
jgi:hypothetical protein